MYLAGPDVFWPEPQARLAALAAICRAHGLDPVTPFDPLQAPPGWAALPDADRIARQNEAHIRACDAVIANLTPFRGVSADVGTAYEVGFARALGLPVYAYTTAMQTLPDRTRAAGADAFAVEDFGLRENLMLACAVALFVADAEPDAAFLACVQAISRRG